MISGQFPRDTNDLNPSSDTNAELFEIVKPPQAGVWINDTFDSESIPDIEVRSGLLLTSKYPRMMTREVSPLSEIRARLSVIMRSFRVVRLFSPSIDARNEVLLILIKTFTLGSGHCSPDRARSVVAFTPMMLIHSDTPDEEKDVQF
jgi:hypothetical protein